MTSYYMDSSALVKRYFREMGTDAVREFLREAEELYTAGLTYAEVYAAFYRLWRDGHVTRADLDRAVSDLETDWKEFIVVGFEAGVRCRVPALLEKVSVRGADSVQLACALSLAERDIEFTLLSSDRKLLTAARELNVRALNPVEA